MDKNFVVIACIILAFMLGAFVWNAILSPPHITKQIEWIDRPIVIPPTIIAKPGTTTPPDSETVRRDSIVNNLDCDSLRALAREKLHPFTIFSIDTVNASDSLGRFSALELIQIEADPWTRIITFSRSFQDAMLRLSKETTTVVETEVNWYVTLGGFIAGLILAIFLLH